jgi:ppGpp synthetase/RelA/SpoT-type nucleotidyltranferase
MRKVVDSGISDPFSEISDLVGLRVVCLFLSDLPRIGRIIRDTFHVTREDDKLNDMHVNTFGYFSVHFDCRLNETYAGPRYDGLAGLTFEVQLRTIAMDAWANVSRHLSYRAGTGVSPELARDFYALSGLFYIADKHFELFYAASSASTQEETARLEASSSDEFLGENLNLATLTVYLRKAFADRRQVQGVALAGLLEELVGLEFKTVRELDEIVMATKDALPAYEEAQREHYADVAALRIALYLYSKDLLYRGYALKQRPEIAFRRDRQFAPYRHLVHKERS